MKYVFGPVPSRRLGRSLGIDPTPASELSDKPRERPVSPAIPRKICNWNCVYCQLGRTRPFATTRTRFFCPSAMFEELEGVLASESGDAADWITFVGSGEPTLNRDLGTLIRGVKSMSEKPVAVITNGSLLSLPEVRRELSKADAVLPTLDAGTPDLFRRVNRPPADLTFRRHLGGLMSFREIFSGNLWLEIMLIEGLNDDAEALSDIAKAIAEIRPDEVHLVLPTRPPAEPWVRPTSAEGVLRAQAILGTAAPVTHPDQRYGEFGATSETDPETAAAEILSRHPMTDEELRKALSAWGACSPDDVIRSLEASGNAVAVERYGVKFWRGP